MASGLAGLYKVQMGVETTWGTTVAATAKHYAEKIAGLRNAQNYVQAVERRGSLAVSRRSYLPRNQIEGPGFEGEVTFEDLPFWLGMALKAAVKTGAGPYVYTHTPSTSAANTPSFYSCEFGDNVQAFLAGGMLAKSLELSGKEGEAWKFKAETFAQSLATTTFTAALTDRTVIPALAEMTILYMDDTGGTIGTTQKTATLIDWTWKVSEHFYPQFYQDGSLNAAQYGEKPFRPELELTVGFNSGANTLRTKYAAGTRQLVRLKVTGASGRIIQLDGAYIITEDPLILDEREGGETICKLKLMAEYDSTDALYCSAVVTNNVSALP